MLLVLLAAGLDGCSAAKFGYNHAERLLNWKIDDYVDLNREQKAQLHSGIEPLLAWHRATQLPRYADWLDQVSHRVTADAVTAADVQVWFRLLGEFSTALYAEAAPGIERLLATLDDDQVEQINKALDDELREARDEQTREDGDDPLAHRRDKIQGDFERWIGRLNQAQLRKIDQRTLESERVDPQVWMDWRERWNQDFIALLKARRSADFHARRLAFEAAHDADADPNLGPALADNRAAYAELISEILGTLEPSQRQHLLKKLRSHAEDCRELAARS